MFEPSWQAASTELTASVSTQARIGTSVHELALGQFRGAAALFDTGATSRLGEAGSPGAPHKKVSSRVPRILASCRSLEIDSAITITINQKQVEGT